MKKSILLSVVVLFVIKGNKVFGQDNQECIQNLSIFAEFAKVKNYDEAYAPWMAVRNECPQLNRAIYSYGERILKDRIKNGSDEVKASAKEDILVFYDQWATNFPVYKKKSQLGDVISKKAQAMLNYQLGDLKTVYNTFDEAFTKDPSSFSNPKHLYNYFKTF
ncbi:MAG: hypothetical protein CNC91_04420, partial [Flavobacteriales bacterium MED-G22]